MMRALVLLASGLLLTGCASAIKVSQISNTLPAGTAVDGIPFRPAKAFRASLYKYDGTSTYAPVALTGGSPAVTIPDTDRLYVLGFHGQVFANPVIEIALNPDSTIDHVSLSSKSSGAAAITASGAQLTALTTAVNASRTADVTLDNAYAAAQSDYFTKHSAYCNVSKTTPLDLGAVQVAAAALYGSELTFARAAKADGKSTPFTALINAQTDVGVGCP